MFVLRKNEIETLDDLFQYRDASRWPEPFFDLEDVIKEPMDAFSNLNDQRIYIFMEFEMSRSQVTHKRTSYSLLDLFGDFGGVLEVGTISIGFLCYSWSEFQFTLKALQKVYNVKTHDENAFRDSNAVKYKKKRRKFRSRLTNES